MGALVHSVQAQKTYLEVTHLLSNEPPHAGNDTLINVVSLLLKTIIFR